MILTLNLLIGLVQGFALFTLVSAIVLFKSKPYKKEYMLFGLSGLTVMLICGLLQIVTGWFT